MFAHLWPIDRLRHRVVHQRAELFFRRVDLLLQKHDFTFQLCLLRGARRRVAGSHSCGLGLLERLHRCAGGGGGTQEVPREDDDEPVFFRFAGFSSHS